MASVVGEALSSAVLFGIWVDRHDGRTGGRRGWTSFGRPADVVVRPFASFDVLLRPFDPRPLRENAGCAKGPRRKWWPGRWLAGGVQKWGGTPRGSGYWPLKRPGRRERVDQQVQLRGAV